MTIQYDCTLGVDKRAAILHYACMTIEVLNVEKTRKIIEEKGWSLAWVIKKCGLTRTIGYALFKHGILPEDLDRKAKVLEDVSNLLGVEVTQLLLTLKPVKRPA